MTLSLVPLDRPDAVLLWAAPLPGESEFSLEDPLALDYLGQQIGYFLLPALTTRSSHAQYFAVVLYGLTLAEQAIAEYGLDDDDDVRRELFERWERFWALATAESLQQAPPRGHADAMRGARGVQRAWFAGDRPLPRDFSLISRQSELGGLGAYLVPLRDLGLVYPGSLRVTPAASPIVEAFWGEPGNPYHQRCDRWALHVVAPANHRIDRKFLNLRLATLGERSRLSSLGGRRAQQDRLHAAIVEAAPPPTPAIAGLVERACERGIFEPREVLQAMLSGLGGPIDPPLRDLLLLARAFGDAAVAVRGCFDAIYGALTDAGLLAPRACVVERAIPPERIVALREAMTGLLRAPELPRLAALPMHGHVFLRLAEELRDASAETLLDRLLDYHRRIQRERRAGDAWITVEGDDLRIAQTRYGGYRADARFPSFKLWVVRQILATTGRLAAATEVNE